MERLDEQLRFIKEIDRLKTVLRQSPLVDASRRENSAEHSWHLAMMAVTLGEYAPRGTDLNRVITMVLLHDIVEIDAGDTFALRDGRRDRRGRACRARRRGPDFRAASRGPGRGAARRLGRVRGPAHPGCPVRPGA